MNWYCDGSGFNGQRSRYAITNPEEKYVFEVTRKYTNNEMEYSAAIATAKMCIENDTIYSDSLLVVNQIKGKYKVRNGRLKPYYRVLKELVRDKNLNLLWVNRKENIAGILLDGIKKLNQFPPISK